MLFLARGLSLSFLLPAPLEATASRPSPIWHRAPSFGNVPIYRARITTCISCNPSFFACNSLTLFAWLRTRDFLFSTSKFDGRRFQMCCGESECSSPPLWREESININFRIGIGAAVPPSSSPPQILFLLSPMSAAELASIRISNLLAFTASLVLLGTSTCLFRG